MDIEKNVLPPDFDGVFRFTNATSSDFTAKWNNIAYTFPAMKTTPMIIPSASPEEVQHIRKKFAKELAEREFYGSERFKAFNTSHLDKFGQPTGGNPAPYTESDLAPFIASCLESLPIAQAKVEVLPKTDETKFLSKDKRGRPVTRVLEDGESLLVNEGVVVE